MYFYVKFWAVLIKSFSRTMERDTEDTVIFNLGLQLPIIFSFNRLVYKLLECPSQFPNVPSSYFLFCLTNSPKICSVYNHIKRRKAANSLN